MCGICGWIDFSPGASPVQDQVIADMTESLRRRGPDDGGHKAVRRGALGHRRLAVIDVEKSRQPMCAPEEGGEVVLVFSGEIYNYKALRAELKRLGHRFVTDGDTEVVLRSYLQWGKACPTFLAGMFAFAVWDGRSETLFLARDRLGVKPLYYYPTAKGLLFGSEPKAILKHPAAEAVVSADGLRQVFGLVRRPGDAVFEGMFEVKPGHWLAADAAGRSEQRYWTLDARAHEHDQRATIEAVRGLLFEVVEEQLVSDVPLGMLLSGGLDSSTLAAIGQRQHLRQCGSPLSTFSVQFGQAAEDFRPDAMRGTLDEPFVEEVVRRLGARHRSITVSEQALSSRDTSLATLRARDLPALGEIDATLYLLFAAVREHCTVAVSGEGADELFGGYRWFHDPALTAQQTFPWLAMARELGRYSMFEPGGVALDVASYQADLYSDALKQVPTVPGESAHDRRMRELTYLHLTYFLPTPLERKDRMSMAVGLEVRVPYTDHRLVEYVFNVPWGLKSFDGREKSLLRAAAEGLLPDSVAAREKSPFPSTQDPSYHRFLRTEVQQLLSERTSPALELFHRPTVRALAAMAPTGAPAVRIGLERILAVHDWLTEYGVAVRP